MGRAGNSGWLISPKELTHQNVIALLNGRAGDTASYQVRRQVVLWVLDDCHALPVDDFTSCADNARGRCASDLYAHEA